MADFNLLTIFPEKDPYSRSFVMPHAGAGDKFFH
jgi:hypothetical protein